MLTVEFPPSHPFHTPPPHPVDCVVPISVTLVVNFEFNSHLVLLHVARAKCLSACRPLLYQRLINMRIAILTRFLLL